MVGRYKVISILMVLVAVFLVFVGFDYLKIDLPNLSKQQSNLSFELDEDWDNDGLTNREESYWNTDPNNPDTDGDGYLDGEEVVSSHDPLIPAPDDLIDKSNLTEKLSQLTLAGLYEGSLKPDSPDYDTSLNNLASAVVDDALNGFKVDLSKINLRTARSDMNSQQAYIEEFSKVYETFLSTFIGQMANLENDLNNVGAYGFANKNTTESFEKSAEEYQKIFEDLSKINVPKEWGSNHLGVIKLTGELIQASQAIVFGKDDPIKATVALNKIIQLWEVLPDITEAYSKKIHSAGLSPARTIFK